jgi:hypothetical protein
MPRRNRNSGTPPPDPAVLAAELAELAAALGVRSRPGRPALPVPYCPPLTPPGVTR